MWYCQAFFVKLDYILFNFNIMLREFVIRFSLLIFGLFLILSGVWAFLFREQMLKAGVARPEVFSLLLQDFLFVVVVSLVLVVVVILCVLIFTDAIRLRLSEFVSKLAGFKQLEEEVHILEEEKGSIYEEKEKLTYVLSYIKDSVIFLNRKERVVLLNKAAEEIVGRSKADVVGKQIGELFKLFEGSQEIQADEYLRGDSFSKKHLRLESVSATDKLVDFICVRLVLIHTQDLGYIVVLHDLTGELEVEKRQVGLLSAFASELRWPLELVGESNAEVGVLQLSVLMENLLTSSLIMSGNVTVSTVVVDLAALLNELVSVVNPLVYDMQLSIEIDMQKDLAARVMGDESRIRQVVLNLLVNAIKYTKSGGKIVVSLSSTDEELILHIQDTGIGMLGEDMKHLFEKFFVGGNVSPENKGLGLGLYVCRGLVDLMDGKIWIDSVEERATVASVSLSKAV